MKKLLILTVITVCCTGYAHAQRTSASQLPRVIFETDMGNDVDDPMALDMLYKAMDRGEIDLIGIVSNKDHASSPRYIDILNTWYGHPDIPIGKVSGGVTFQEANNYAQIVCESGAFPRTRKDKAYRDAVPLYRRLLAESPDSSVVIVSVGFSTNLGRLLESKADNQSSLDGIELVRRKVAYCSVMAGSFGHKARAEFNVVHDIANAKRFFALCPVPIVLTPFELGKAVVYPCSSIESDFTWAGLHPLVEAYKVYRKMPYDRPTWDMLSVLYALQPAMFTVSEPGIICVDSEGYTYFTPTPRGQHTVLSATTEQAARIRDYFLEALPARPAKYD